MPDDPLERGLPADGPPSHDEPDDDEILGENPDDEVLPASPARRRGAAVAALIFIVVILTFLIWFIASNTKRYQPRSIFGTAANPAGQP